MRIVPRAKITLCMTIANTKPMTSSNATVMIMITTVVTVSRQNSPSLNAVQ